MSTPQPPAPSITRRTALQAFFAILASKTMAESFTIDGINSLNVQVQKEITYVFSLERITLKLDGRTATFTAKELADALGAK